jgi:hypothetical protein
MHRRRSTPDRSVPKVRSRLYDGNKLNAAADPAAFSFGIQYLCDDGMRTVA